MAKKVVIVGGGFGGIQAALDLTRSRNKDWKIILVSDKPHFEYYPGLYRVVAGHSPLETCIPLELIFEDYPVKLVEDRIIKVDLTARQIVGRDGYQETFDYLILALGSEAAYFNIPGLAELSFGLKSTMEAIELRKHLEAVVASCVAADPAGRAMMGHIVIVGGGPAGVELAGELAAYTAQLAGKYKLENNPVTIDLLEAAPRLLSMLAPDVSERVKNRLHALGVNIFLNRGLVKEEVDEVFLKDMQMKAKTIIWTAGVKPSAFFSQIAGLTFDKRGRVMVDEHLAVPNFKDVFVIGDGASTQYSGLAQTAIDHAHHVAKMITNNGRLTSPYKPKAPVSSIPVGRGWAVTIWLGVNFYGRTGWWLRRAADLRYFLSILPLNRALKAFKYGATLTKTCKICLPATESSDHV